MSSISQTMFHILSLWTWSAFFNMASTSNTANSTFLNPILPGWHSDPSCIFVPEYDDTFFCATSTFLVTPGIPIYASKDLVTWRLTSHVLNRPSQVPNMNLSGDQSDGIFAPTLRYHGGFFYLITVYVFRTDRSIRGLLFKSEDPYNDHAWSEPVLFTPSAIDPDLFWHDNGKVYVTSAGTTQMTIDLEKGDTTPSYPIWPGTGGISPEGPHIYLKDHYYYLMIGEGGTETNHSMTMARSVNIDGPYESYEGNPVLTAKDTSEYFQTVGHGDLFQDANTNWWIAALSTRSGPLWKNYPMGREPILSPVTWLAGYWPVMDAVRGKMEGWPLPPKNTVGLGKGPVLGSSDSYDFEPGSSIPPHFSFWRWPVKNSYAISPPGHSNALRLRSSRVLSSSTDAPYDGADGITLLMRLQEHTLFTYSVDVTFMPGVPEEEAGATVFLTQQQHIDLGIVIPISGSALVPHLRLRTTGGGNFGIVPDPIVSPVPSDWLDGPITLKIQAQNDTHYIFSAASPSGSGGKLVLGSLPATIVSRGTGPFTGTLLGVYATSNGGNTTFEAFIGRWRYQGHGQKIDPDVIVV